jgi:hypothetical protein
MEFWRGATMWAIGIIALISVAAQGAFASEAGNPPDWCRNGAFATDQDNLRLVRALRRTNFLLDSGQKRGCPQAGAPCSLGDLHANASEELLINSDIPGFVCAYSPKDGDGGWIAKSDIVIEKRQPTIRPSLNTWTGHWKDFDDRIDIARWHQVLMFDGHASWARQHFGSFGGTALPNGATAEIEDDSCKVSMLLFGRYLVVHDNGECGGMNVSFTGVYTRR